MSIIKDTNQNFPTVITEPETHAYWYPGND